MADSSRNFAETENFEISVPHGHLEARFERPSESLLGGALLCHPHPQHGGTMHTKALYHLTRTLNEVGFATLRFNFRGVGTSTGTFDEGEGEKADARAALETLNDRVESGTILMGGFSFGAVVGLRVGLEDQGVDGLIALGLPVSLSDVKFLAGKERPLLIVQGELDQFGPPEQVRQLVDTESSGTTLKVVPGAKHLFSDQYEKLRQVVRDYFTNGPGASLIASNPD